MSLNYSYIRIALIIIPLYLSIYFFTLGYNLLNQNVFDQPIIKIILNKKEKSFDAEINKKKEKTIIQEIRTTIHDNLYKKNHINNQSKTIIVVKKNDTFGKIINPFFSDKKLKNDVINSLNKEYNLKNLKIDQKIYFYKNTKNVLEKIVIPINFSTDLVIKISNHQVQISKYKIDTTKETISNKISIQSSLYEDGINGNIPITILSDTIRLLSFDVDFQRDIQKNNTLEISYEILSNKN